MKRTIALVMGAVLMSWTSARAEPVAYIDQVYPKPPRLAQALKVERRGRDVPLARDSIDLEPGDQLFVQPLAGQGWTVVVRYISDNSVVAVRRAVHPVGDRTADMVVRKPAVPSLPQVAFEWLKEQIGATPPPVASEIAGSRGGTGTNACYNTSGRSDDPIRFRVPILTADRSRLVEGRSGIFLSWHGGATPFTVTLTKVDSGAVVASNGHIMGCATRLAVTSIEPGTYKLEIKDAAGVSETEDHLVVGGQPPPMPTELLQAQLNDADRQIYYATWLTATNGGTWALEAMQRVESLGCDEGEAREWLLAWGGEACPVLSPTTAH